MTRPSPSEVEDAAYARSMRVLLRMSNIRTSHSHPRPPVDECQYQYHDDVDVTDNRQRSHRHHDIVGDDDEEDDDDDDEDDVEISMMPSLVSLSADFFVVANERRRMGMGGRGGRRIMGGAGEVHGRDVRDRTCGDGDVDGDGGGDGDWDGNITATRVASEASMMAAGDAAASTTNTDIVNVGTNTSTATATTNATVITTTITTSFDNSRRDGGIR